MNFIQRYSTLKELFGNEEKTSDETPVEEIQTTDNEVGEEKPVEEETPVEEIQTTDNEVGEEKPVEEETPVEETPVEETPVEETPVDDTTILYLTQNSEIYKNRIMPFTFRILSFHLIVILVLLFRTFASNITRYTGLLNFGSIFKNNLETAAYFNKNTGYITLFYWVIASVLLFLSGFFQINSKDGNQKTKDYVSKHRVLFKKIYGPLFGLVGVLGIGLLYSLEYKVPIFIKVLIFCMIFLYFISDAISPFIKKYDKTTPEFEDRKYVNIIGGFFFSLLLVIGQYRDLKILNSKPEVIPLVMSMVMIIPQYIISNIY